MTAPRARTYVATWLALVVLATASLVLSRVVPGQLGVALAIAAAKMVLVAAIFMHLASGRPIHRVVFGVAIAFILLLVLGVLADVGTRSIASAYVDDVGRP